MNALFQLQAATIAARNRTGNPHIGTQVAGGLVDVVIAVPPKAGKGRYTVTVLHPRLDAASAVAALGRLQ